MSLGMIVKSPSGIVLAADSRVTISVTSQSAKTTFPATFDNATKLLRFNHPHSFVGAVTYGQAIVPKLGRTAESLLPELEAGLPKERLSVGDFAQALLDSYRKHFLDADPNYKGPPMVFNVGGYDADSPYGRVFVFKVPTDAKPEEQHPNSFGVSWGGQMEIVDRIAKGFDVGLPERITKALGLDADGQAKLATVLNSERLMLPIDVMALQDCVDLALTLIRTTISMQQLAIMQRGVGGPIDIATVTRTDGLKTIRIKEVRVDDG